MKYTEIANKDGLYTYKFLIEPEDYKKAKNLAYLKNRFRLITEQDQRPSLDYFENNFAEVLDRESVIQLSEDILSEANALVQDKELVIKPTIVEIEHNPENELYAIVEWADDFQLDTPIIETILSDDENEATLPEEPTEEEVDAFIQEMQLDNARLVPVEEAIDDHHTVSVDLVLYADEGEEASRENNLLFKVNEDNQNYNRVLFDSKGNSRLVGHNLNDTFRISLAQPNSPNAFCEVTINQIYNPELPELDDDFASEVSEFDTFDEFKANVADELRQNRINDYLDKEAQRLLEQILIGSSLKIGEQEYEYIPVFESLNNLAGATAVLDEAFIPMGLGEYKNLRYQSELPFLATQSIANDLEIELTDEEVNKAKEDLPAEIKSSNDFFANNYLADAEHLGQLYNKDDEELVEFILLTDKIKSNLKDQINKKLP